MLSHARGSRKNPHTLKIRLYLLPILNCQRVQLRIWLVGDSDVKFQSERFDLRVYRMNPKH